MIISPEKIPSPDEEKIAACAQALIEAIFSASPQQRENFRAGVGVMVSVQGRDMNISLHKPFFPVQPGAAAMRN